MYEYSLEKENYSIPPGQLERDRMTQYYEVAETPRCATGPLRGIPALVATLSSTQFYHQPSSLFPCDFASVAATPTTFGEVCHIALAQGSDQDRVNNGLAETLAQAASVLHASEVVSPAPDEQPQCSISAPAQQYQQAVVELFPSPVYPEAQGLP